MAGFVKKEDILDEVGIKQSFENVGKKIIEVTNILDGLVKSGKDFADALGGADNFKKLVNITDQITKANKDLIVVQNQKLKLEKEIADLATKSVNANNKKKQSDKEIADSIKALRKELAEAKKAYEDLDKAGRKSTEGKDQLKSIKEKTKALDDLNKTYKDNIRSANDAAKATKKATEDEIKAKQSLEAQRSKAFVKSQLEEEKKITKEINEQKAAVASLEKQRSQAFVKGELDKEKQITKELREQEAALRSLEAQRSRAFVSQGNKDIRDREKATKLLAQEQRLKIAVDSQEEGSIARLRAENKLHAFQIRQLNPLIEKERAEIIRLNQAINSNHAQIQKLSPTVGMWGKLTSAIASYVTAYVSVQGVMALGRSVFNQTKELDQLSFSFKTIIKDHQELIQTQGFLTKTAEDFGQSLINLTERYMRFRAASLQSNMTALDTQKIFYSFGKAAAVLGLKTDEVSGVFLALEQMISKGKISTEELRRQLGERLSGAFGIFAQALGVTTAKLDKMLKSGKVLTVDVLPKAAEQLEKAYGIESVNKVDNLAAAQGRLNTAWTEFIRALDQSGTFKYVLEKLANPIRGLTDAINGVDESFIRARSSSEIWSNNTIAEIERIGDQARFEAIKKGVNTTTATQIQNATVISELDKKITSEKEYATARSEKLRQTDIEGYNILTNAVNNYRGELLKQFKLLDEYDGPNKGLIEHLILESNSIEILKQKYKELTNVRATSGTTPDGKGNKYTDLERAKNLNEQELEDFKRTQEKKKQAYISSLDEMYKDRDQNQEQQARYDAEIRQQESKDKLDQFDWEIAQQKLILANVKLTAEERADITTKLAKLQADKAEEVSKAIIDSNKDVLNIEKAKAKSVSEGVMSDTETKINKGIVDLNEKARLNILEINNAKNRADKIRDIENKLSLDILKLRKQELQAAIDGGKLTIEDKKKYQEEIEKIDIAIAENGVEQVKQSGKEEVKTDKEKLRSIGDAVNEGFNFSQQIYSNQEAAAKRRYDNEIAMAGDSAEAKIIAERKYQEESIKIRKKQDIADRAQAIFNIGLTLAMASAKLNAFQIIAATLAMASVIAKPVPEYFMGTENLKDETFSAGERGAELIEKPDGTTLLTPNKKTIFSDKSFIGSRIIPADKTQAMLTSYAISQGNQVILDMSESNRYLKSISNNTKNQEQPSYDSKGRLTVKRGFTTTHYTA